MPDPEKVSEQKNFEAENEIDSILGDFAKAKDDTLGVVKGALPKVKEEIAAVPDEIDQVLSNFRGAPKDPEAGMLSQPVQVGEPEVIKRPWYSRLASQAKEGASDAGTALKPYFAGMGGMAPNPEALAQDQAAAREASSRSPVSTTAAKIGAAAAGGAALGPAGLGDVATGGVLSGLDTKAAGGTPKDMAVSGLAGAGTTSLLKGLGPLLQQGGNWAKGKAGELYTHSFMNPAQRAAYQAAKGEGSLGKLGQDAREAGIFKGFGPANAEKAAHNASVLKASSGKEIGALEDEFTGVGHNPDVPISHMVDELRGKASNSSDMVDPLSKRSGTRTFDKFADSLAATPPPGAEGPERGALSLKAAIANKRDLGNNVNWLKNPGTANTPAAETARKYLFGNLKEGISNTLESEASAGRLDPQKVAAYKRANSTFSTASSVLDPALKMAEKNKQGGLSLGALVAGTALGGGPGGLAAAGANSMLKGTGSGVAASTANAVGGAAQGLGKAAAFMGARPAIASPIVAAKASLPPGTPKSEVEKSANSSLKSQIQEAAQNATSREWWQSLLPRK